MPIVILTLAWELVGFYVHTKLVLYGHDAKTKLFGLQFFKWSSFQIAGLQSKMLKIDFKMSAQFCQTAKYSLEFNSCPTLLLLKNVWLSFYWIQEMSSNCSCAAPTAPIWFPGEVHLVPHLCSALSIPAVTSLRRQLKLYL